MNQFTLKLDKKQQRPVVLLKDALTALVDTGAFIPVWTDDEEILVNVLDGKLVFVPFCLTTDFFNPLNHFIPKIPTCI